MTMEAVAFIVKNFFNAILAIVDAFLSFMEGLSERAEGLLGGLGSSEE